MTLFNNWPRKFLDILHLAPRSQNKTTAAYKEIESSKWMSWNYAREVSNLAESIQESHILSPSQSRQYKADQIIRLRTAERQKGISVLRCFPCHYKWWVYGWRWQYLEFRKHCVGFPKLPLWAEQLSRSQSSRNYSYINEW